MTGASSGIGAGISRRLSREGHHVILTGRRIEQLEGIVAELTGEGHRAEARTLDVTDRGAYSALIAEVIATHGRLDVLVGNAGVMLLSRLESLLVDEWDRMFDVNVRGLYNGIATVLPHFRERGSGHFVTIASVGAHQVVNTSAIYAATKYAAWALTEGLRQESDPSIRVTTISPGVVESELAEHITDHYAAGLMTDYRAAAISPDAIGHAVSYAISQPENVDVNEIIVRPTRQR
ncbi:SDR family oxidoreductase [Plantibacter sp. Mn2098]